MTNPERIQNSYSFRATVMEGSLMQARAAGNLQPFDASVVVWVGLSKVWSSWLNALVFVQPDTVVRWQRARFRRFWARLSRSNLVGTIRSLAHIVLPCPALLGAKQMEALMMSAIQSAREVAGVARR